VRGPFWMGMVKRKSLAPSGVRTVRRCTATPSHPSSPLKLKPQRRLRWRGVGRMNVTRTHAHAHFFLVFRRVKPRGRVCRQFGVATEQKGNLRFGLIKKKAQNRFQLSNVPSKCWQSSIALGTVHNTAFCLKYLQTLTKVKSTLQLNVLTHG
jgi:hypothetical protein